MLSIAPLTILFIGNSHTTNFDVPAQVRALLESAGSTVITKTLVAANLEEAAKSAAIANEIKRSKWDVVILQGAAISQSHKFRYSQAGAIQLAKSAVANGSRVGLFAEWPRRDWNETEYILGIYQGTAKETKCEAIPVPRVWDAARAAFPKAEWWAPDGNHSGSFGAYTASFTIAGWISPKSIPQMTWRPKTVSTSEQSGLRELVTNSRK